ncbi:MAG: magnesium/cobalt transporter CorA [Solirubrobacterales bacterium]
MERHTQGAVIVDCAVYEQGRRREGKTSLADASRLCRREGSFAWLGLHEPSHEEFEAVKAEFGLHPLAVEDAVHAHQRPKLEVYDDTLFFVLKPVRYIDPEEVIETGEILLFVNPAFVITVRHGRPSPLQAVRTRLDSDRDLIAHGPGSVLYAILDHVVDGYEPVVDGVGADIQQIEAQVFSGDRRLNPAERIYRLESEVLEFDRDVTPLATAVDRLLRGDSRLIDDELRRYIRDVHDHLLRVVPQIQGFRELLSTALHANLAQISVRQNEDMRKISAWVAILAVPTAVAGIYGMNFEHMPELRSELGYPAVLILIAITCLVLHRRFKRAGWL